MSMDLVNERGTMHFTVYVWDQILALAAMRAYGWKPAGTLAPKDWASDGGGREWSGGYFWNGGQTVTAEDAARLASALERALDDIPDAYSAWHKAVEGKDGGPLIPVGANLSPLEALSGENKTAVREFITFCRQGAFEIH
jgi:hypothetical protein